MGLFFRRVRDVQLEGPFVFVVDDGFAVTGRGPILTGEVVSGWITKGQEATLLLPDGERPVVVRRLESCRRGVQQVAALPRSALCWRGLARTTFRPHLGVIIRSSTLRACAGFNSPVVDPLDI